MADVVIDDEKPDVLSGRRPPNRRDNLGARAFVFAAKYLHRVIADEIRDDVLGAGPREAVGNIEMNLIGRPGLAGSEGAKYGLQKVDTVRGGRKGSDDAQLVRLRRLYA
jgi:hypothetical protein